MPVNVTVMYPMEAKNDFKFDYYMDTHMPLVQNTLGKDWVSSYRVTEYSDGPYSVQALLHWNSEDEKACQEHFNKHAEGILGDIKNFSATHGPNVFIWGKVKPKSSL